MASLRDLKSVPTSATQANKISWAWFIRLDLPSPIGTKRFTDYPVVGGSTVTFDIGDGAGSQSWDVTMPFKVGSIKQSIITPRDIAQISFGNQDAMPGSWTSWSNTLKASGLSLTGSRCRIYMVWFDPATGQPYATQPELGDYDLDNHALGNDAQFALIPHVASRTRPSPWYVPGPLCPYRYRDGDTCQYGRSGAAAVLQFVAASSQAVDCGASATLKVNGDFTVMAWIRPTASGTAMGICGNEINIASGFSLRLTAGGLLSLRLQGAGTQQDFNSPGAIPVGVWTHVAAVVSGTSVTLYVNGFAVGSVGTVTITRVVATANYQLARMSAGTGNFFTGQLSDERFYNVALSGANVLSIVNGTDPTTTPRGQWKLEDGTGTTPADSSGNGNNGTFVNVPTWVGEPVGETTCAKTFKNCSDRGNQAFFGGDHLMPKPGEKIYFGTTASTPSGV
jgi:hypothetical protein